MDELARELSRKAGDGDLDAARRLVRHLERSSGRFPLLVAEFPIPPDAGTAPGAFVVVRAHEHGWPWATYRRNDEDGSMCEGRYFQKMPEAVLDWSNRVREWAASEAARGQAPPFRARRA